MARIQTGEVDPRLWYQRRHPGDEIQWALFDAAKVVCAARGVTALDGFQSDSLPIVILGFLDDFAHPGGRHSNINKLTGHRHQAMVDPIARWGEIASQIMQTQATPRERERAQMSGRMANIAFGNAAPSLMSDIRRG